jgi:hypothetical protein
MMTLVWAGQVDVGGDPVIRVSDIFLEPAEVDVALGFEAVSFFGLRARRQDDVEA